MLFSYVEGVVSGGIWCLWSSSFEVIENGLTKGAARHQVLLQRVAAAIFQWFEHIQRLTCGRRIAVVIEYPGQVRHLHPMDHVPNHYAEFADLLL